MAISSQHSTRANSANRLAYASSFLKKSHHILKAGYDRLNPTEFAASAEEDITGELTRGMQDALQASDAPRWYRQFWAAEEVHVHHLKRRGNSRKRLDIEIIKSQTGERPILRFEAKRLRTKGDAKTYLGANGLGCFLDGSYGPKDDTVGMIGYVQQDDIGSHATAIQTQLIECADDYSVDQTATWKPVTLVSDMKTYCSRHFRTSPLEPVHVIHTMLKFN